MGCWGKKRAEEAFSALYIIDQPELFAKKITHDIGETSMWWGTAESGVMKSGGSSLHKGIQADAKGEKGGCCVPGRRGRGGGG